MGGAQSTRPVPCKKGGWDPDTHPQRGDHVRTRDTDDCHLQGEERGLGAAELASVPSRPSSLQSCARTHVCGGSHQPAAFVMAAPAHGYSATHPGGGTGLGAPSTVSETGPSAAEVLKQIRPRPTLPLALRDKSKRVPFTALLFELQLTTRCRTVPRVPRTKPHRSDRVITLVEWLREEGTSRAELGDVDLGSPVRLQATGEESAFLLRPVGRVPSMWTRARHCHD